MQSLRFFRSTTYRLKKWAIHLQIKNILLQGSQLFLSLPKLFTVVTVWLLLVISVGTSCGVPTGSNYIFGWGKLLALGGRGLAPEVCSIGAEWLEWHYHLLGRPDNLEGNSLVPSLRMISTNKCVSSGKEINWLSAVWKSSCLWWVWSSEKADK